MYRLKNHFLIGDDLAPLALWSIILPVLFLLGGYFTSYDLSIAVILLIKENANKITVLLGSLGFISLNCVYLLTPKEWKKGEKIVSFLSEQFFGLIIGASAFTIASILMVAISDHQTFKSTHFLDLGVILLICLLSHYCHSFYKELNDLLEKKDRAVYAGVCSIVGLVAYFILKNI